ncbi:zinc finger protein 728-like isoform X4 [Ostrinia nubilalis]|uniref:zinc finger protein 728-like isoform X4 n=1 Tax=Ostrinia nubilalis TaxID=29057 RepID=UPI0030823ABA
MAAKTTDWRPGPTVCRCCLSEGCYKDISTEYFWMGKREVYSEMLSETFSLSIAYSTSGGPNSNSRLICEPCISRLRDASDFKRQVQECEKTFMQYLDPGTERLSDFETAESRIEVTLESLETEVKVEQVKTEKDESDGDDFGDRTDFPDLDDDDDDLDDQPLTRLATRVPKKESVDTEADSKPEKRKATTKAKTSPAKKAKTKKEVVKATTSKAAKPTEKKKKGIIQASPSTVTIKDDEGNNITLNILRTPICLDNLKWEYEDAPQKNNKIPHQYTEDTKVRKPLKLSNPNNNVTSVLFLKDPICLDEWNRVAEPLSQVTYNVKTIQGSYVRPSRKANAVEFQAWKQNALVIFENSYVYPFVHSGNKYKCFVCAKQFLDPSLLKEHTTREHNIKDLQKELNNRLRDKNLKIDISDLQCRICLEHLPNFEALKVHLKDHGKNIDLELTDNLIPFRLGGSTFECQVCGENFLKLRLLIIHMSKHFNNYNCEVCGSVFISLNLLKRHQQTHVSGNYPCEKCDKVFSNSAKRTLHMRGVHLKQLPRRCPICPERFNSNYQRTKHLRIVHNQTNGLYRCETCGREYDLKYHLLIHIRSVHLQERNQECPICHSRFFSKYCLSRHMVIHTGEKNFKCNVCGKAYARRKNLREHFRVHELSQTCSVCGQVCADQASLGAHMNGVHGVL